MINDKEFSLIKNNEDACIYKKLGGSAKKNFQILYVDDISLFGNDVSFLDIIKILAK
jgi:hypothetical protein